MPKMIMVTISGANFDFGDSLSELCLERLNKAIESFKNILLTTYAKFLCYNILQEPCGVRVMAKSLEPTQYPIEADSCPVKETP